MCPSRGGACLRRPTCPVGSGLPLPCLMGWFPTEAERLFAQFENAYDEMVAVFVAYSKVPPSREVVVEAARRGCDSVLVVLTRMRVTLRCPE